MEDRTCSVEGCDRPHKSRGWCGMHAERWRHTGDPVGLRGTQPGSARRLLEQAAISQTDDCILLETNGDRPLAKLNGRRKTASRIVWILANGDPGEAHVLHSCGDGSGSSGCVNIRHLYLGTHQRNMQDMRLAGRVNPLKGANNPNASFTDEQVVQLRERYASGGTTQAQLADEHGVSFDVISRIIRGKTYKSATRGQAVTRPNYSPITDEIRLVAQIYREHIDGTPTLEVARQMGYSRSAAGRRIKKARCVGLLPPTTPGRRRA